MYNQQQVKGNGTCPSPGTFGSRKSEGDSALWMPGWWWRGAMSREGEEDLMAAGSRGDAGKSPRRGPSALPSPQGWPETLQVLSCS